VVTAIETKYKGYRFRSRLEARWAVFFESLGDIKWVYEDEGYKLSDSSCYLPDFKISNRYPPEYTETWSVGWVYKAQIPLGCWDFLFVEIKPAPPSDEEIKKLQAIAALGKFPHAYFLCGTPGKHTVYMVHPEFGAVEGKNGSMFEELVAHIMGDAMALLDGGLTEFDKEWISAAIKDATEARFEFGEVPKNTLIEELYAEMADEEAE
jgi:hypothetical protein